MNRATMNCTEVRDAVICSREVSGWAAAVMELFVQTPTSTPRKGVAVVTASRSANWPVPIAAVSRRNFGCVNLRA